VGQTSLQHIVATPCSSRHASDSLPSCPTYVAFTASSHTSVGHWQVWAAYSPVKNSPADARAKVAGGTPSHSATQGELDIYAANCRREPLLTSTRRSVKDASI